jgi:hypothetical protein
VDGPAAAAPAALLLHAAGRCGASLGAHLVCPSGESGVGVLALRLAPDAPVGVLPLRQVALGAGAPPLSAAAAAQARSAASVCPSDVRARTPRAPRARALRTPRAPRAPGVEPHPHVLPVAARSAYRVDFLRRALPAALGACSTCAERLQHTPSARAVCAALRRTRTRSSSRAARAPCRPARRR